jgi:N-acetylglucosamine-6-sulfatase
VNSLTQTGRGAVRGRNIRAAMEGIVSTKRRPDRAVAFGLFLVVVGSVVFSAAPSHAAVVSGSPNAPVATALDGKVLLRWSPPAHLGSSPLNQYRVQVTQTKQVVTVPVNHLNTTIGKLVNGSPYTFTVSSHSAAGWSKPSAPSAKVYPTRPNIVLIMTDDQRWDSMAQLPATNARTWRRYTRAFVDEPMCCPSRAGTFTGRLPTHTKVQTNGDGSQLDVSKTFATMLHRNGYQTAFAGKYLNGYPFGRHAYKPPGWDKFYGMTGPLRYYDYTIVENGKDVTYGTSEADYSTDVLRNKIVGASKAFSPARPVLLDFAPNAPHRAGLLDPTPARRDTGSCANTTFPVPPSFNAYDTVSEPTWMAGEPLRDLTSVQRLERAMCETLRGADTAVSAIFNELAREGRLANTYVVFTSDNGYHFGEHRLLEKGDIYDESVRVPLLVTGPGVVSGTDARLTSNIDIAPTFLEWAGVTPPKNFFDGTSFAASARGVAKSGPTAILLRGCRTIAVPGGRGLCGGYETNMGMNWGLRTATWKYIEYPDGEKQLFDVVTDPYEMTNLAPDPAYAATITALHDRMVAMGGG